MERLISIRFILLLGLFFSSHALIANAAGAKQQPDEVQADSGTTAPPSNNPKLIYAIDPQPFPSTPVALPGTNGTIVELSTALDEMFQTSIMQTTALRASVPTPGSSPRCGQYTNIRAAITDFELDDTIGVVVGYNSTTGAIKSGSPSIQGSVTLKLGTLVMDFFVDRCDQSGCVTVINSTATQAMIDGDLSVTVNFDQIQVGPDLVWNTNLGNLLQQAMNAGLTQISNDKRIQNLYWSANVIAYDPTQLVNQIFFDEGTIAGVGGNQTFVVYENATVPSSNSAGNAAVGNGCGANIPVGLILTNSATTTALSSSAQVTTLWDTKRGIQVGDTVMGYYGAAGN